LPERQLTADEQQRFAGLRLHDLEALYDPARRAAAPGAPTAAEPAPSVRVDDATAREIVELLRPLPRPAIEEAMHELRIARVRDLTVAQLPEARRLIQQLAAAHAVPPPTDFFA
jgi:hypothetical protein